MAKIDQPEKISSSTHPLGEDELRSGTAAIRDMAESEQRAVPFDQIENALAETKE